MKRVLFRDLISILVTKLKKLIGENMSRTITFNELRKIKDQLPSGSMKKIADELSVPFLGAIPIDIEMRKAGDEGRPFIIKRGNSPTWAAVDKVMEALINVVEG